MRFKTRFAGILAILLLLAVVFALPVAADERTDEVEEVVRQLRQMQQVQIDPEWLPDIRTNQGYVQSLLDGFLALTEPERSTLTDDENEGLRAYFAALYEVQGKDPATVDDLFAAGGVNPPSSSSTSASASSSNTSAASSSSQSSSTPSSSSSQPASSASVSTPGSVVEVSSQPGGDIPSLSTPGGNQEDQGLLAFFGSNTLGVTILALLVGLCIVLFIRFLVALRAAGKVRKQEATEDERSAELFGEAGPSVLDFEDFEAMEEEGLTEPPKKQVPAAPKPASAPSTARMHPAAAPEIIDIADTPKEPSAEPVQVLQPEESQPAEATKPAAAPEKQKRKPRGRQKKQPARRGTIQPPANDANEAAPPKPLLPDVFTMTAEPAAEPTPAQPLDKQQPPPQIGRNPDRANSITLGSFSGQQRTGKPPKMTFRQGAPDDLDAIDE